MPEVEGIDRLLSIFPKKKFGLFRLFGTSQFAHSNYGDEDIYFIRAPYGIASFGADIFADAVLLSGIYRTDNVTGTTKFYREPFYITKNPCTPAQQTNRQKYADGILAWQGLTDDQKKVYNKKAIGKRMSGYNLFLKEYLLSH